MTLVTTAILKFGYKRSVCEYLLSSVQVSFLVYFHIIRNYQLDMTSTAKTVDF